MLARNARDPGGLNPGGERLIFLIILKIKMFLSGLKKEKFWLFAS